MTTNRAQFVDKKLIFRLRIFVVLFLILLSIVIYDVTQGYLRIWVALGALALSIVIGFVLGRVSNVIWHEETSKAVTKMDIISAAILIVYIPFTILRRRIFSHWFSGNELSAFIFCLSTGIMLGRILSIRRQLLKILKQQGKF